MNLKETNSSTFKINIKKIETEVVNFVNSPKKTFKKYISKKLNRSLSNYMDDVNLNIKYLVSRKSIDVMRHVDKMQKKEEKNK